MAIIPVPKPPAKAFNPKRRAGLLLIRQVEHLEWAVRPASQRQPGQFRKIKPPKTEAEAATRIEMLTRQLHPDGHMASATVKRPVKKRAAVNKKSRKRPAKPMKRGSKGQSGKAPKRAVKKR